jgi:hypothetical protein
MIEFVEFFKEVIENENIINKEEYLDLIIILMHNLSKNDLINEEYIKYEIYKPLYNFIIPEIKIDYKLKLRCVKIIMNIFSLDNELLDVI